jgi:hypothetical protein
MTCIIRSLFHVPCPTCGVTRAMVSLLQGNFTAYSYYNVMALPLCAGILLFFIARKIKKTKLEFITFAILIINFVYYIFRAITHTIP